MARAPGRRASAAAYLASRTRLGIKFGLETISAVADELGRPQLAYPTLLVAGTNGKGSVAAYADAGLRAAGLVSGRYTSPHLVRVHERITVGGEEIAPRELEDAVAAVRSAAERLVKAGRIPAHPTFFETLTAAAFLHFRAREVDAAVLEVGMGGRLDATNTAEPAVSAIVTIAMDHEEFLGRTPAEIAGEKAGVLRAGRATVLGPLPATAEIAIRRAAERIGAVCVSAMEGVTAAFDGDRLDVRTPRGRYRVKPLPGRHQRDNAVVALRLLEEAAAAGLAVDVARAAEGFADAHWPGRLQRVAGRPPLLLDGAHNPSGAAALADALRDEPPFVLVFGAMADKDVASVGRTLFPLARTVVLTRAPSARAAEPAAIAERVGPAAAAAVVEPDIGAALRAARVLAGRDGLVVVAGSLYLVGDVLRRTRALRTPSPAAAAAAGPRRAGGARRVPSRPAADRPRPRARRGPRGRRPAR